MAGEKGNTGRMVEILERIASRLDALTEEVRTGREDTNRRLDALTAEVHAAREEARSEYMTVLPEIHANIPGSLADRVAKLEAVVFRPTGT